MFNKKSLILASLGLTLTTVAAISPLKASEPEIVALGQIEVNRFQKNIIPGNSTSIDRTITLSIEDILTSTAPDKLDIVFLADNTDSMGAAIANVQANASTLLSTLSDTYGDVKFGVARYYGDPSETFAEYIDTNVVVDKTKTFTYLDESKTCVTGQGEEYPCYKYEIYYKEGDVEKTWTNYLPQQRFEQYGDSFTRTWQDTITEKVEIALGANNSFQLQANLSSSADSALDAIDDWATSSGGDWAEGSFFALQQLATNGAEVNGQSTGQNVGWRDDAKKIIVWFGDAQSHTDTIGLSDTVHTLKDNDITVVGIHVNSTERSQTQGLNNFNQASTIANATSGVFASTYSDNLSDTITALIGEAAVETYSPAINLDFISQGNTDNLDVIYTCIDERGCTNAKDGDVREFRMDITVNQGGEYVFQTVEKTTGATADNAVTAYYPD